MSYKKKTKLLDFDDVLLSIMNQYLSKNQKISKEHSPKNQKFIYASVNELDSFSQTLPLEKRVQFFNELGLGFITNDSSFENLEKVFEDQRAFSRNAIISLSSDFRSDFINHQFIVRSKYYEFNDLNDVEFFKKVQNSFINNQENVLPYERYSIFYSGKVLDTMLSITKECNKDVFQFLFVGGTTSGFERSCSEVKFKNGDDSFSLLSMALAKYSNFNLKYFDCADEKNIKLDYTKVNSCINFNLSSLFEMPVLNEDVMKFNLLMMNKATVLDSGDYVVDKVDDVVYILPTGNNISGKKREEQLRKNINDNFNNWVSTFGVKKKSPKSIGLLNKEKENIISSLRGVFIKPKSFDRQFSDLFYNFLHNQLKDNDQFKTINEVGGVSDISNKISALIVKSDMSIDKSIIKEIKEQLDKLGYSNMIRDLETFKKTEFYESFLSNDNIPTLNKDVLNAVLDPLFNKLFTLENNVPHAVFMDFNSQVLGSISRNFNNLSGKNKIGFLLSFLLKNDDNLDSLTDLDKAYYKDALKGLFNKDSQVLLFRYLYSDCPNDKQGLNNVLRFCDLDGPKNSMPIESKESHVFIQFKDIPGFTSVFDDLDLKKLSEKPIFSMFKCFQDSIIAISQDLLEADKRKINYASCKRFTSYSLTELMNNNQNSSALFEMNNNLFIPLGQNINKDKVKNFEENILEILSDVWKSMALLNSEDLKIAKMKDVVNSNVFYAQAFINKGLLNKKLDNLTVTEIPDVPEESNTSGVSFKI